MKDWRGMMCEEVPEGGSKRWKRPEVVRDSGHQTETLSVFVTSFS